MEPMLIRAIYRDGVLIPITKLNLPEGEEFEITVLKVFSPRSRLAREAAKLNRIGEQSLAEGKPDDISDPKGLRDL